MLLACGCGSTPRYGPPPPGPHPSPSVSLQLFRRAETGRLAQTFQANAAAFNRATRDRRVSTPVLGEDASRVAGDIQAWSQAMRKAPVPPDYQQAKARLRHGLALLRQGYRHIGAGLLYGDPGQLSRGRADVRSASAILGAAAADVSV